MALTRINGNLISSGTITGNLFLSNTITGNLIAPAAVTGDKIGLTAITSNLIASGVTITSPVIASANLTTALTLAGATGNNGQVLTSSGSGLPSWTTISSGFSLISTQLGSGANNVTWSGLSGSTNYLVVLSGLADTTGNRDTRIRIGTGGTILTSGYVYSGHIYGAGGPAAYGGTGAGLILSLEGSYLRYFYGFIYITQPPDYSAVNFNGATNDNTYVSLGNNITGAVPTSAIISDIRVYSANNFTFGSAALYKMSV